MKNNTSNTSGKSSRALLISLWTALIAMILLVTIYIVHLQSWDWRIEFWAFVISIFSAIFSFINVLAFYKLTVAIENQNDKRQQEALRYDALKYQLERQQEVFSKVELLNEQISSGTLFNELEDNENISSVNQITRDITNKTAIIQTLANCSELFPTASQESIQDLLVVSRAWKQRQVEGAMMLLKDSDTDPVKDYAKRLADFWGLNQQKCIAHLMLLLAQMSYDMQVTLSESLGQTPPEPPSFADEYSAIVSIREIPQLLERVLKGENVPEAILEWDLHTLLVEDVETDK